MESVHATAELFVPRHELRVGDSAAVADDVEQLFRQHSQYVASIAMRLLGSNDAVDDVVQDVFVTAIRRVRTLRDPAAVRGWLAKVAVRISIRKLRRRRLRELLWSDEAITPVGSSAAATSEQRVLLAQAYRVLDRLPVNERVAWLLRYVEDAKLEDLAAWCDCSLATIKRRIASAQSALEREMR
jgi:RNA polymerase sigma-70 factor, ECF subfamily